MSKIVNNYKQRAEDILILFDYNVDYAGRHIQQMIKESNQLLSDACLYEDPPSIQHAVEDMKRYWERVMVALETRLTTPVNQ